MTGTATLFALSLQLGLGFMQDASLRRSVAPSGELTAAVRPMDSLELSMGYAFSLGQKGFPGLVSRTELHRATVRLGGIVNVGPAEVHAGLGPALFVARNISSDEKTEVIHTSQIYGLVYGGGLRIPGERFGFRLDAYGMRRGQRDDFVLMAGTSWSPF